MKVRSRTAIVTLAATALLAAACGSSSAKSAGTTGAASTTPGVTASAITVGNVSTLGGPVPGLFQGAPFGVDAYFDYINSKGGVHGRKLVLKTGDDALNCNQRVAQVQSLYGQVFAFVGSFSTVDNCSAPFFTANPTIADVSKALTPQAQALPNNFSAQTHGDGFYLGPLQYYKDHYPAAVKAVGTIVPNSSGAISAWNDEKAAMESIGYHIAYERTTGTTETDFTADVLRMRDAGVQMVSLTQTDIATMARFLNAMQQQNWHPQLVTTAGTAYNGNLFKLVNPGAAEGMINDTYYAMYQGEDRATVPEIDLFLTWLGKTHPGFKPDLFAVNGWASARLFVQALEAGPATPTQADLMAQLKKIHSFDSNGLIASNDPAGKVAPTCYIFVKVHNNAFERFDSPKSGFRCSPGGFHTNSGG
jgi:ABC-type branched-subunit amino acid transport system substrate-binding protein